MFTKKLVALVAIGVAICSFGGQARAGTDLVWDQFLDTGVDQNLNDLLGPPRQVGALVPSSGISYTVEKANSGNDAVWFANDSSNAPGMGGVWNHGNDTTHSAWQDLDYNYLVGRQYDVSTDVKFNPGGGPVYLAVAQTQDAGITPSTGAMAQVDLAGNWALYLGGSSIASGTVASATAHHLQLGFNEAGTTTAVSLEIDNRPVASGSLSWSSGNRYLGVAKLAGAQSTAYVDNLKVQDRLDTHVLDTFNTVAGSTSIHNELGSPRQSGTLVQSTGIDYVTLTQYGSTDNWYCSGGQLVSDRSGNSGTHSAWQDKNETALAGTKYEVSATEFFGSTSQEWSFIAVSQSKDSCSRYLPTDMSVNLNIDGAGNWGLGFGAGGDHNTNTLSGVATIGSSCNLKLLIDETGSSTIVTGFIDGISIGSLTGSWTSGDRYVGVGALQRGNGGNTATWDDLALNPIGIPEPSSMAILASAIVGLLAYAWRKRR